MVRAQQVEPLDGLAHQASGFHPPPRAVGIESLAPQRFLALRDLLEAALERIVRPQRFVNADQCGKHRQRRQRADQVIDGKPIRQPILEPEIWDASGHSSSFAILTMMPMPVASMNRARPISANPRMSPNSGMM